jgi:hypothetical protein
LEVSVPPSLTSYLWAILSNSLPKLKQLAVKKYSKQFKTDSKYLDNLLEETFRYLLILAETNEIENILVVPSEIIGCLLECLVLNTTLFYKICDSLLTLIGVSVVERPMRVLPFDPFFEQNNEKLTSTLTLYKERFGHDAPAYIWQPSLVDIEDSTSFEDTTPTCQYSLNQKVVMKTHEPSTDSHQKKQSESATSFIPSVPSTTSVKSPIKHATLFPVVSAVALTAAEVMTSNNVSAVTATSADITTSNINLSSPATTATVEPITNKNHITFTVRHKHSYGDIKNNTIISFNIPRTTKMSTVFYNCSEHLRLRNFDDLRFFYKGKRVKVSDTPQGLGMKNGDVIDMYKCDKVMMNAV